MTDNEIIKVWEHCIKNNCTECPYCEFNDGHSCITKLMEDVFELYKSQRAENRKLQLEKEKLEIELKGKIESSNKSRDSAMEVIKKQEAEIERLKKGWKADVIETQNIKAEAIKEFAERLKEEINIRPTHSNEQNKYVCFLIDNLVKEMVGEQE